MEDFSRFPGILSKLAFTKHKGAVAGHRKHKSYKFASKCNNIQSVPVQ
jgi:hypothetical protein